MTTAAVIACALAVFGFFAWHIVTKATDYGRERDAKKEIEKVRNELADEIRYGGNIARIARLRARLLALQGQ